MSEDREPTIADDLRGAAAAVRAGQIRHFDPAWLSNRLDEAASLLASPPEDVVRVELTRSEAGSLLDAYGIKEAPTRSHWGPHAADLLARAESKLRQALATTQEEGSDAD